MAYTIDFDISLGSSKTGLTLNAQIVDTAGSASGAAITTGFTEIGDGCYLLHTAAVPDDHRGGIKVYEQGVSGTILGFASINPQEGEYTDAPISIVDGNVDSLISDDIPGLISALNNISSGDIAAALSTYDAPTNAEMLAALAASNDLTAADVWAYATRTLTENIGGVTVISAVSGSTITVYAKDTWSFTVTDSSLALDDYEVVVFVAKRRASESDDDAIVHIRSDSGLMRIGKAAPVSADNGSLTNDTTSFTVSVAIDETGVNDYGDFTWWLKSFDTTPETDTGFTLATGTFSVKHPGIQETS